jgi:hypothetical protein
MSIKVLYPLCPLFDICGYSQTVVVDIHHQRVWNGSDNFVADSYTYLAAQHQAWVLLDHDYYGLRKLMTMNSVTKPLHMKSIALLLALLALVSLAAVGTIEMVPSDDGTQISQEEGNSVALVRHLFVLEISLTATYLSHESGGVLPRAPFILNHTNRGPPTLA